MENNKLEDWSIEVDGNIIISVSGKTVCFETLSGTKKFVGIEPVNTFDRYNEIALILLKTTAPDIYNQQVVGELKQWQLGGMTQEIADYLLSVVRPDERGEVILMNEQ